MADETGEGPFPRSDLPTAFADVVMNFLPTKEVVRFYLGRFDPSVEGRGPPETTPVVQVVMPVSGFANAFVFFEKAIENLVANGAVKESDLDMFRKGLEQE